MTWTTLEGLGPYATKAECGEWASSYVAMMQIVIEKEGAVARRIKPAHLIAIIPAVPGAWSIRGLCYPDTFDPR